MAYQEIVNWLFTSWGWLVSYIIVLVLGLIFLKYDSPEWDISRGINTPNVAVLLMLSFAGPVLLSFIPAALIAVVATYLIYLLARGIAYTINNWGNLG